MDEVKLNIPTMVRRNEDIALDLMRFVAEATNYARAAGGKGFHGEATAHGEEQNAQRLLALYRSCLAAVQGTS